MDIIPNAAGRLFCGSLTGEEINLLKTFSFVSDERTNAYMREVVEKLEATSYTDPVKSKLKNCILAKAYKKWNFVYDYRFKRELL